MKRKSTVHKNFGQRGFSLLEIAVVMIIVAFLLTSIGVPLATQVEARRTEETRRLLEEAKDALIGFAMANGRFPCPAYASATSNSAGQESFCAAASGGCVGSETQTLQTHGNCSHFYDGFLPAATLGLSSLDEQGFIRDGWGVASNRVRYAVSSVTVGPALFPFTSQNGMQSATISNLGAAATNYLQICNSGTGVTATTCGGAANTLTTKTPILLLSLGQNAAAAGGADESKNTDNNIVFVSHTPVKGGGNDFDDIVTWIPINTIIKKMLDAGKLP